jgi:hypothetical protein
MINLLLFCFTDITDILKSLEEEKRDEECDEKTLSTNIFFFINLYTIQCIIYILFLIYYRISNTDTINELCTKIIKKKDARISITSFNTNWIKLNQIISSL